MCHFIITNSANASNINSFYANGVNSPCADSINEPCPSIPYMFCSNSSTFNDVNSITFGDVLSANKISKGNSQANQAQVENNLLEHTQILLSDQQCAVSIVSYLV